MLAESKWAGTALGWAGLCLCAVFLLSHVLGFCFMTVRCFKSVSPCVKQKDIPEADTFHEMKFRISIEAFISCTYFISSRRITFLGSSESFSFQAWELMLQNGHSEDPYHLVCFCPKHTRSEFQTDFERVELDPVVSWEPRIWSLAPLKSGRAPTWAWGAAGSQETIQNQWGCFDTHSPIYSSRTYLEFLFLGLCYFLAY